MASSAMSGPRIRSHNERLIAAHLRDNAPLSRAQLSDRLGLTRAAMSRIVGSMIERGLILESGTHDPAGVGRPGRHLELSTAWAGIGVDVRAERTELLLMEMGGRIIAREALTMPSRPEPERFVEVVSAGIAALAPNVDHELTGIGVAIPGLMSEDRSMVERSHHLGWNNVALQSLLREHTGLPVALRHGAECAAIINARQPELKGSTRLLHVQIGTGLGLALTRNRALDDTLPVGWGGAGHVLLGDPRLRCICGRHGCVDTAVGFEAFVARSREAVPYIAGGFQDMYEFAARIGALAQSGEPSALELTDSFAMELGRILAVFITIEVPDSVTMGGYVASLGDIFLDRLDAHLSSQLLAPSPLVRTKLGTDAASLGAAMVGLSHITNF